MYLYLYYNIIENTSTYSRRWWYCTCLVFYRKSHNGYNISLCALHSYFFVQTIENTK